MAHETTIQFFDMFSGIGGFRAGLERAGSPASATARLTGMPNGPTVRRTM